MKYETRSILKGVLAYTMAILLFFTAVPATLYAENAQEQNATDEFADFQVITPSTLGIEDTAFETSGNISTPTAQKTQMSINEVKFCATMSFHTSSDGTVEYLENASGTGLQLLFKPNYSKYPILCNYLTSGAMYAGGSFVGNEYQGGAEVPAYNNTTNRHYILEEAVPATTENGNHPFHNNREFTLWYTTQLVDFDNDGNTDDLKLGIWFNETLYKDIYFYIVDCAETYLGSMENTNIHSVESPVIEPEQPDVEDEFADFQVITPSTLGIEDTAFETSGNISTPTAQKTQMSINKVKFCATMSFHTSSDGTVEYLENASGTGLQLLFKPNYSKYPILCNYLTSGAMYAGGSFVGNEYQGGAEVPAYNNTTYRHYILEEAVPATTENGNHPFHNNREFTLWYTTQLVDFDNDGNTDDLKLGIWFNETLYKDIYFYIVDCAETYLGSMENTNIHSVASPVVETDEVLVSLKGNSVTLDGTIGINYYMYLNNELAADTSRVAMHFTFPNSSEPMVVEDSVYSSAQEAYVFTCKIPAKHMADEIIAQAYVDGVACEDTYTLSVKQYANELLNDSTQTEAVQTLVKNMLHYGAYSQIYFNYNTNALANEGLDALDLSTISQSDFAKEIQATVDGLGSIVASSLNLKSGTSLNIYIDLEENVDANDYEFTCDNTKLVTSEYKDWLVVQIPNIAAHDLDKTFTIEATKTGDAQSSAIFTYSVFSYAYKALDTNANVREGLVDLMKAMYLYNQAANAVAGN